jgi:hypothetical protein
MLDKHQATHRLLTRTDPTSHASFVEYYLSCPDHTPRAIGYGFAK